jgi:hypothetical protein
MLDEDMELPLTKYLWRLPARWAVILATCALMSLPSAHLRGLTHSGIGHKN